MAALPSRGAAMDEYAFIVLIVVGGAVYVVGFMTGYAVRAPNSRERRLRVQRLR
jgi:hypothetical protein